MKTLTVQDPESGRHIDLRDKRIGDIVGCALSKALFDMVEDYIRSQIDSDGKYHGQERYITLFGQMKAGLEKAVLENKGILLRAEK